MGNLILSGSPKAAHPYYSHQLGIHIYTAEELSYYIYNNLLLLEDNFIDDRLLLFLEKELDMAETAAKIRNWKDNAEFEELLLVILQDSGYYNSQELQRFGEQLERFKQEGVEALYMEKADYLSNMGKLYMAIEIYNKLLSMRSGIMSSDAKRAKVYAHMAADVARLFDYNQAYDLTRKAYAMDPQPDYLRQMYMISKMAPDINADAELSGLDIDLLAQLEHEFEQAQADAEKSADYIRATDMKDKDAIRRNAGLTGLVIEWQNEYRRCEG